MDLSGDAAAAAPRNDPDGFPPFDPAKRVPATLADCRDDGDRLDYLCAAVQGSYQRRRQGSVVELRLRTAAGDVVSARAPTTAACITQLLERCEVTA